MLSPDEAQRAIYIDFEGSKDKEPAILGSLWAYGKTPTDDKLRCVHDIHHPSLRSIVDEIELSHDDLKDYQQHSRSIEQSLNALLLLAQANTSHPTYSRSFSTPIAMVRPPRWHGQSKRANR